MNIPNEIIDRVMQKISEGILPGIAPPRRRMRRPIQYPHLREADSFLPQTCGRCSRNRHLHARRLSSAGLLQARRKKLLTRA